MSNVINITSKLDDWRVIEEFYTEADGDLVVISGNYRKNAHEIKITVYSDSDSNEVKYGLMDIAQLQNAIKQYEERQ